MKIGKTTLWALAFTVASLSCQAVTVVSIYPSALFDNTTGFPASTYLGAPDDTNQGIGSRQVTYDFGVYRIYNDIGQDFNVYETDSGTAEFSAIDVLVSLDGLTFYSVKSSEAAGISIPGDSANSGTLFRRSYNLGASPLTFARYLRIDGLGTAAAGAGRGFDLDAVGVLHAVDTTPVEPLPDGGSSALLMAFSLTGVGALRKYLRRG